MFNVSKYFSFFNPERYGRAFLKSKDVQNAIALNGYCVIPLLEKEAISALLEGYKMLQLNVGEFGNEFWPSGRHPDPKIRTLAKKTIEKTVPKLLEDHFINGTHTFIGGTYLIKPPSEKSALNPHQDSSHVNEFEHFSVYVWIPLQDVDANSGCVQVLPKSHQISIKQRSLNVPWVLQKQTHLIEDAMIDVPMKAGQALIFDAALIHSSPPNLSDADRVAINFYVHPSDSPFCHYYCDEETPAGEVEVYSVTPDFYYEEDFESKPNETYKKLPNQKIPFKKLSDSEVSAILMALKNRKWSSYYHLLRDKISGI